MVHVAQSQRLCQRQIEDGWIDVMGYVRSCYVNFIVFNILDLRAIVVI
jgi:hypothetical protein